MADSVHFATWDDEATPANASGFNGHQYPSEFGIGVGPNTKFPVQTGLQNAVLLRWRAKKWIIASDFTVADGTSSFALPATAFELNIGGGGPATRELDLVLARDEYNVLLTGDGYSVTIELTGRLVENVSNPLAKLYYPYIVIGVAMQTADLAGNAASLDVSTLDFVGSTGTMTISVNGHNITAYKNAVTAGTGVVTASSFALNISEWWPYKGADGNPIYNTVTGAQLQNPRN